MSAVNKMAGKKATVQRVNEAKCVYQKVDLGKEQMTNPSISLCDVQKNLCQELVEYMRMQKFPYRHGVMGVFAVLESNPAA